MMTEQEWIPLAELEIEKLMSLAVKNFRAGRLSKARLQIEIAFDLNGGNWNPRGRFMLECKRVVINAVLMEYPEGSHQRLQVRSL